MGNPVTWLLLFAVAITSTLVQAQDITFCLASLNSDGELVFTYSYDFGTDFNTRQMPVVKVSDGTNDLSLHHSIGGSSDNLETLCDQNLRVCMADIGLFSDPVVKKLFIEGSENTLSNSDFVRFELLSDDSDSTATDCYVVGREIEYFGRVDGVTDLVESDDMVASFAYNFNLGFDGGSTVAGENIGITAVPTSITKGYVAGGTNELTYVRITFSDSSVQTFGDTTSSTNVDTDSFDAADVATIEIVYDNNATNSTTNPSVCDVRIYDSSSSSLISTAVNFDCGNFADTVEFSVPTGFTFAGFVGFNAFDEPTFTLEPIAYGKLQPQIYYYESNADSSVTVFVNSFFDLTGNFLVEYIYPDGLDGSTLNYHTESNVVAAVAGESGEIEFSIPSQCGCTMIDIHYAPHFSADDFLQPPDVDAYGYNSAVVSDELTYDWGGPGTEEYSTGSKYWVTMDQEDLDTADCTMMRPRTYLADLVDGVPYIDGLMGKVSDSSGADVSLIQQIDVLIDNVLIHDWDDDDVLDGLVLVGVDGSTFEIGVINDTTPQTFILPESDDDRHLLYLTFQQNDQLQIVGILGTFGASLPPCFFDSEPVPDSAGFQQIAGIDLTADSDNDADMYQIFMYMPNDFASITAELTGSFLDFSDVDVTYLLKLTADGSYARTSVITVFFYHLQAETDYSAVFYAETTGGYVTTESLAQTFMTPHGVRMECEQNGNMVEQVEWEALPDVEVKMIPDADSYVIDGSVNSVDITTMHARDFQTDQWPEDLYFHFEPNNDNYPKYDDFEGFPKDLLIYYDDTCILGFGLVFETRNDMDLDPIWLVGSQTGYDDADGGLGENTRASIENMSPIVAVLGNEDTSSNNVDCLSAIQLEYDTGFSNCIGPEAGCPDLLLAEVFDDNDPAITSDDDIYHIYSFSVSVSDGVIMGLAADYAFVDIPVVLSSDTCVLDDHINYYWLRNTAWTKLFSLNTNFSDCSITKEVYYDHDSVPVQEIFGLDQNDIDGHEIVYRQTLVREADLNEVAIEDTEGGLTIIRQNYWQVNLYCYYEAEATVDNTFSVEGEDEQYIAGTNEFDFELNIYHSNAFDDEYTAEPTMLVGEPVYMAVEMLNTEAVEFYVTAFDCWATETNTQSRDSVNYYTLTGDEGCLEDDTFQWFELNDQFRDGFLFEAFAWYENGAATTETVYVHCRVEACLIGNDGECTAKDPDQECAKRARRDTDDNPMERTKRQSEKVEKIVSASTPFKVQKRDVSNLDIDRSDFSFEGKGSAQLAAGMFSMFATTMFFCLLVISYRIYKLRRNNYALLQDAQTSY